MRGSQEERQDSLAGEEVGTGEAGSSNRSQTRLEDPAYGGLQTVKTAPYIF